MYLVSQYGIIVNTDSVFSYNVGVNSDEDVIFANFDKDNSIILKTFTDKSSATSYLMNNLRIVLTANEKWVDLRKEFRL